MTSGMLLKMLDKAWRLFATIAVACATSRSATAPPDAQPLRVGKIIVHAERLFNVEEAAQGGFYRAANLVAVPTRERLIRKFLLFNEGDPLDEEKLRETEHNLRALDFLKSAVVTKGTPHDGVVDVVVT